MEKRSNQYVVFEFTVNCQLHTQEEVLEFMRTKVSLKMWAFKKESGDGSGGEGEHYRCKISLGNRLRKNQIDDLFDEHLCHASNIKVSSEPKKWGDVTSGRTRVPGGGPWTSWTEGPENAEKPVPRKSKITIKATVAKTKEIMDLLPMTAQQANEMLELMKSKVPLEISIKKAKSSIRPLNPHVPNETDEMCRIHTECPLNHEPPTKRSVKATISVKKKPLVTKIATVEDIAVRTIDDNLVEDKSELNRRRKKSEDKDRYPAHETF